MEESVVAETSLSHEPSAEAAEKDSLLWAESTVVQVAEGKNGRGRRSASLSPSPGRGGEESFEIIRLSQKEEKKGEPQVQSNSEEESLIPKPEEGEEEEEGVDRSIQVVTNGNNNKKKTSSSSIAGASMNFINSIIGSGIIGIPSALQQSGFLFGVLLLLVVAVITDYTVILLIKDGILSKKFTYQDMVTTAYGQPGYWYLTLVQFLFPFFAMAGYIVITGDTLSRILQQIFYLADYDPPYALSEPRDIVIKVAAVIIVMLPLCLFRNIAKLEKFSGFAVVCIVFIVTVTFYEVTNLYCTVRCFQPAANDTAEASTEVFTTWFINKSFVQGIGIMGAAFVCHHNTYLIYASLSNRSLKRFSIVSHVSVSTSFVFCAVLGLSGFLAFQEHTQGDLLNNYCGHDPVANSARFFFALVIMLTYPIECFVGREVMEISLSRFPRRWVEKIRIHWLKNGIEKFLYTPRKQSLPRHIFLTFLLVFSTLFVGASTNDLGVVLAFNGCFTAVPLAFIIPTACFLKLSKDKWCSVSKIVAILVMLFGILVMAIGTVLAILETVQSYLHKAEQYRPLYCIEPDAFHNTTCCQLFNSTSNFTVPVPLCDCSKFCPDQSLLPMLSEDFCTSL